jgi:hypothetical protein
MSGHSVLCVPCRTLSGRLAAGGGPFSSILFVTPNTWWSVWEVWSMKDKDFIITHEQVRTKPELVCKRTKEPLPGRCGTASLFSMRWLWLTWVNSHIVFYEMVVIGIRLQQDCFSGCFSVRHNIYNHLMPPIPILFKKLYGTTIVWTVLPMHY